MSRSGPHPLATALSVAAALALPACSSDNDLVLADAALDAEAAAAAHAQQAALAHDLRASVEALCAAAPAPAADGWVPARDGASIEAMKAAWRDARRAYAGLEGTMRLLSPEVASALDIHYEEALAAGRDPDLFDGQGFVGLHAVERVLWSNHIPPSVVLVESKLDGYAPAAFPADAAEAKRFGSGLCARLVADAAVLEAQVRALPVDSSASFESAVLLVEGQGPKLVEAGARHETSRYASYTLAELSDGLAASRAAYRVFRPWLLTKLTGPLVDGEITAGFNRVGKEYAAIGSDALPYVPMDWSASALTHEALETPFGQLYIVVSNESNDALDGSLAHSLDEAAKLLGL